MLLESRIMTVLRDRPLAADRFYGRFPDVARAELDSVLVRMNERRKISVLGPSNGNSDFGIDPERFGLWSHRHLMRA